MLEEYGMNIAIRGTGKFGKYIASQIKSNKNYTLAFFIDSNVDSWGKKVEGVSIISPDDLQKKYWNDVDIVLIAYMNSIDSFERIVISKSIKYGFIRNRVYEAQLQLKEDLMQDINIVWCDALYLNKPILRSLETNIVDDCNLNCRGCSHFSNLFEHGARVPYEVFCKDLKQVADKAYVHQLNLLGGEAILNERIVEYMDYARKLLPYSEIELISNGLLIPKQTEEFFECCKKNDITISISGYKPTLRIKDKIRNILEKHHIVYIFREDVNEFGKNIDIDGKADRYEAVKKCRENKCHFLREGKIYKCPFEALGNVFFEHFGLNIRFDGGTNIYDDKLDWRKFIDKLYNEPIDACRYCGNEVKIEWGVTSNPILEDWTI